MITVEIAPLCYEEDNTVRLTSPEEATLWGVYTRTPDADGNSYAEWVSDHESEFSAELAAARLKIKIGEKPCAVQ